MYPKLKCPKQAHYQSSYQYYCLDQHCKANNRSLACLYCIEQTHNLHKDEVITVKQLLMDTREMVQMGSMVSMIIEAIKGCVQVDTFRRYLKEIAAFMEQPDRYQGVIDHEMQGLGQQTIRHYQRGHQQQTGRSVITKSSRLAKGQVMPVLTFKEHSSYTLLSPFSIAAKEGPASMVTVWAHPSLSKYHQSVSVTVKIDHYTPSWLGVGLSIGQTRYEQGSNKHLMVISNGWTCVLGKMEKSKIVFGKGDVVTLKWDKNRQIVEISSNKHRQTYQLACKWEEQVYLCVCLFYPKDAVSLLC